MAGLGKLISGLAAVIGGAKTIHTYVADRRAEKQQQQPQLSDGTPQVTSHQVNSIDDRIKYIRMQALKGREHPKVREVATSVLSQKCGKNWCVPEKNWEAEVKALFAAVRARVRYTRDWVHRDLYQHPARTLALAGGDCDDFTSLLGAMLMSVGYPCRARVIQTTDSQTWNHIYLLVGMPPDNPTRWVPLDASVNRPAGWEAPAKIIAKKRDFDLG